MFYIWGYMNLNISKKNHIISLFAFSSVKNSTGLRQLVGHAQPVRPLAQLTAVIQELRLELQRPVEALALLAARSGWGDEYITMSWLWENHGKSMGK